MNYKAVPKEASDEVPGIQILQADRGNPSRNMNETT